MLLLHQPWPPPGLEHLLFPVFPWGPYPGWTSQFLHVAQCDLAQGICANIVLSLWYSMLNVNLVSDSTNQCWVASKLGVVMM